MTREAEDRPEVPGWVILDPDAVPEEWRSRAVPMMLVPLAPRETEQLLAGAPLEAAIPLDELPLIKLLAKGLTAIEISRALGLSTRTVYRRVARLRDEFAVATMEELSSALSRRGF